MEKIIPVAIEDEMKRSYIDYAMSVIVSRAIPDVRDGLKPVHRRILYAMHELVLTPDKPFKKSATVVGECFVRDTLVVTSKGLAPIQDIKRGDLVYTQNGTEQVTELYEMPERELIKIHLENGSYNTTTKSQQFKIIDENLEFKWKEAEELTENDYIVMRSVFPDIKEYLFLPSLNGKTLSLNENIGYLLGQLISDGWIERGYNRGKGLRVGFCSSSRGVIKKIQKVLEKEFGYKATIEEKNSDKFKTIYSLRINREKINDYIVSVFGLENVYAETKFIPRGIFNSPKNVIFSFISGLIDGDGSVHKKRNAIHYGSTSERLIDRLMLLLECFGIIGRKYKAKITKKGGEICGKVVGGKHPFYSVEFEGINAGLLASMLELLDEEKSRRLKEIISNKYISNKYDVIPFAGGAIFEELSRCHIDSGWYLGVDGKKFRMGIKYPTGCKIRYSRDLKDKNLGKTQIENWQIREKLNKIGSPLSETLNEIFQNGLYFLRVKKVEKVSAQKTFDIQVDNAHEFIANGMLSHNCLGKFHPHGDLAVYDAITRMVQDFSLRYPLIDGQGNFGSIDGDAAAAYRYTEIRLSKLALYLLKDIEKNTVDFVPNFDGRLKEPVTLPASFPNLLVNGVSGIAVGMATNIPPHNMGEVIDALITLIEDPDTDPFSCIKGPDFPTGGIIVGKNGIVDYALTGKGKVVVKARATVEKTNKGKAICITEIPYQVNKSILIERIAGIIKEKKIEAVTALRDESDRKGMRIVIELKKTANEDLILNNLYKHTQMRTTFGVNLLALKSGVPVTLPLKEMLTSFLEYRYDVVERRTKFELEGAEKKAHILEGLKIAVDNIDEVVNIIKKSKTTKDAKDNLMIRFSLTDVQAQAILDMKLSRLVGLEREKLQNEYTGVIKEIERLRLILLSKRGIYEVITRELLDVKEKFADKRRTEIIEDEEEEFVQEDLIPNTDVVIMLTKRGYIKRCPLDTYRTQARGGYGTSGIKLTSEDVVSQVVATTNHVKLILFTEKGKAFNLKAYEIPEMSRTSRGRSINNLLGLSDDDRVISVMSPSSDIQAVFITTKFGITKKIDIEKLRNIRRNGVTVVKLKEDDVMIGVEGVSKNKEVLLVTKNGRASRINENEVRMMGRSAQGVIGMRLKKNDYIVTLVSPGKMSCLFTVTEDGHGKRVKVQKIRKTRRGSKGVVLVKGTVAGVVPVDDDSEVICVTQNGQVIKIKLKKVRIMGRAAKGVRVIFLKENDKVVAVDSVNKE